MMKEDKEVRKMIKETIEKVLRQYDVKPLKIILFGSRARGNYKEDSDWDILVIVRENLSPEERRELWFAIYSSLHKKIKFSSFDIIVKSKKVYDDERFVVNTISNEAYKEGISL